MNSVVFHNVKKQLGEFVLDIPHLEIKKGYITGFVGENGSGKTTTMKLILDMLIPDSGYIEIDGKRMQGNEQEIKKKIGYVGDPTGYPEESKLKDIKRMYAPFYETWDEKLFTSYIGRFKLNLNQKYKALSTGQKKQFALVMALAHKPTLILLDEPTSGLDPVVRQDILDVLMEHMQDEEVSIFYSTHITSDIERAGDYLVYIKEGKIQISEPLNDVLERYCIVSGSKQLFTKEIEDELLGYRVTAFGGEGLVASRKEAEALFGREVTYKKPNIEEVMILLASRGGNR